MRGEDTFLLPVTVSWNNDVGYNDEGYWEWWEVIDRETKVIARCDNEQTAKDLMWLINTWGNNDGSSQFG